MAAFDYSRTAETALRLLVRFGALATLKRTTTGPYDPSTGTSPVTTQSLQTTAVVLAYPQRYIDGTLILQGDQQAFCAPSAEPKQGDAFTWQGRDYSVIMVKPTAPAGIPVLFEVQLRG